MSKEEMAKPANGTNKEMIMRLRPARTVVLSQINCCRTHMIMLKIRYFILEMM